MSLKNLLRDIGEALRGTERDFTSETIGKSLLLLSIPMVLEMMMESLFALVDIFFVSKLGAYAVSVVGLTESMMTIVYTLAIGLSVATTALVARRTGEKHSQQASEAAMQGIWAGVLVSIPIAIVGVIFAPNLLTLMGADTQTVTQGVGYTRLMLGLNVIVMLLFIINSAFRGVGDAAIAMRVLIVSNIINMILDPIFIFGFGFIPAMGVEGAAVATCIGRSVAVIYQLYVLFKAKGRLNVRVSGLGINIDTLKQLFSLSLGSMGQFFVATSSWIFLMRLVSISGSAAVAGYTIAIRILLFGILPAYGISNAAATLVGQNLGANQPQRAEKSVWMAGGISVLFVLMLAIACISFPQSIVSWFSQEPDVIEKGSTALRWISYGFVAYALGMVLIQSLNGAGDTRTPTYINIVCFWLIQIPLAYILAIKLNFAETGVYWSILVAETLITIIAVVVFRRGKWKNVKI